MGDARRPDAAFIDHSYHIRPLRWFFFFWQCFVYIWGVMSLLLNQQVVQQMTMCHQLHNSLKAPCPDMPLVLKMNVLPLIVLTMLMAIYGIGLWFGTSGKIAPRYCWLYFSFQGGVAFGICYIVPLDYVVVSLYLILVLSAIHMLQQIRLALVIVAGFLALLLLNRQVNIPAWTDWSTLLQGVPWSINGYTVLFLFVVGYLLLHIQQVRAHTQLDRTYTALRATHEQLEKAHLQLRESAVRIEDLTRQTERQRLARELHDTLVQGLVGLKMQLETVDELLTWDRPKHAQEIVQQAMAGARETLMEARGVIDDLRVQTADATLFTEAVQKEIHHFETLSQLHCHIDVSELATIAYPLNEQVLRFISEGLTNVMRHAQAQQASIRVIREQNTHVLEICDDGVGFDPSTLKKQAGHYGLLGMQERAHLIGGRLEIISQPGGGTTIRFWLPNYEEEP